MSSLLILALLLANAAPSQADQPQEQSAPAPHFLSGPSAEAAAPAAATLVSVDFEGKVVRLEMDPAEAAVRLLDLDDSSRSAVEEILSQRAAILDEILLDNLSTVVELSGAADAGDTAARDRLAQQLQACSGALRERGRMIDELSQALGREDAAELRRVHREYWSAVIAERREAEPRARVADILRSEGARVVGQELRRSYERVIGSRVADFEALLSELALDPVVEGEIRSLVTDFAQQTLGKPTPRQKRELLGKIWPRLNQEQRGVLLRRISGPTGRGEDEGDGGMGSTGLRRRGPPAAPRPPEQPAPSGG